MSNLKIHAILLIGLIFEAVVVKAESEVSFLASICDDEQRLFCIAALIESNWIITTEECRVASYDLIINKLVYAGHSIVDCIHGESRQFKNIKKLGKNLFGSPSNLLLVKLSRPFAKGPEITIIEIEDKKPAKGTNCKVYHHQNITDPFKFVQNLALDRQYRSRPAGYEIEMNSGHIVPCSSLQDESLICMEIKTVYDYKNSPLVCNRRLVGVVLFTREDKILVGKHLGSYRENFENIVPNVRIDTYGCSYKWQSNVNYLFIIFAFLNSYSYNISH